MNKEMREMFIEDINDKNNEVKFIGSADNIRVIVFFPNSGYRQYKINEIELKSDMKQKG